MEEICSGLLFPEGPIAMSDGSVILVEIARGTLSPVSYTHLTLPTTERV